MGLQITELVPKKEISFKDLYNKKIPVYADTSIKCKHLIYNRPYPWSKIKK